MQDEPTKTPNTSEASVPKSEVQSPPAHKKKTPKTGLIIGIVGAILLIIAAVCLYLFWYQEPQKVITDSLAKAVSAERATITGHMSVKGQGNDVKVSFDMANAGKEGQGTVDLDLAARNVKLQVKGEVVMAENSDMYVKVVDLKKAVDAFIQQALGSQYAGASSEQQAMMQDAVKEQFDPIVKKLDNKWIRIKPSDLKDDGEDIQKLQKCMNEINTLLKEDGSATREIRSAYNKNQFIVIDNKLGSKDGALGYEVSIDEDKAKVFGEATKDSKLAQKAKSCSDDKGDDDKALTVDDSDVSSGKVEVWVDRWSHNLKSVKMSGKQDQADINLEANFDFNRPVEVTIPSDAMSVEEVTKELEALSAASGVAS